MRILVTGSSGFIGSRLVTALVERGHDVRAMTRRPADYRGGGSAVYGDLDVPDSLRAALDGVEVAYYLAHSLDAKDFVQRDARAAREFAGAAAAHNVRRIVYLGGMGGDDPSKLSPHLRSRREVEDLLRSTGVPTTVLRAAIVVGDGGTSWEITRQLVKNLPLMLTPKWVATRTQPIAVVDAVRYLVAAAEADGAGEATYDIGGPDVLTYAGMLQQASQVIRGRSLPIVVVPVLTPQLSSMWISLVTDVDVTTARNLIASMDTEVIVQNRGIEAIAPGACLTYQEAVRAALAERADRLARA